MKKIFKFTFIIIICILTNVQTIDALDGQIILCEYEKEGKKVAKIQFNPITLSDYMPDINPDPGQWMVQYKKQNSDNYEFFQWQASTIGTFEDTFYRGNIISWGRDETYFPENKKNEFTCPKYINIEYDGMWHRACFSDKGRCDDNGSIFEYQAKLSTTSDTLFNRINKYASETVYTDKDFIKRVGKESEEELVKEKTKNQIPKIIEEYKFGSVYAKPNFIKNLPEYYAKNLSQYIDIENSKGHEKLFASSEVTKGLEEAKIAALLTERENATPERQKEIDKEIEEIRSNQTQREENIKKEYFAKTAQTRIELPDIYKYTDCEGLLGEHVSKIILNIFKTVQYAGPLLVIVFTIVDFVKAVLSGEAEDMKKASNKLVKRLVAAILLFFVPLLCNMLLDFANITTSSNCTFG